MPLQIVAADITKIKVDAIVNAANNSLLGGADLGIAKECVANFNDDAKGINQLTYRRKLYGLCTYE